MMLSQIGSTLQACKNSNLRSFSMSIPRLAPTNDTNRATSSSSRNHNVSTPRSTKQGLPSISAAGSIPNRNDSRRFLQGRNYAPKNLNFEHIYAERRRRTPPLLGPSRAMAERNDEIFKLGLRPGHVSLHDDSYKNPVLLSNYVSVMGRIKPRRASGLTQRSQREVAKAIRRAQNMGLMPVMSKMQYKAWSQ
jgi:ribosomal protein S18